MDKNAWADSIRAWAAVPFTLRQKVIGPIRAGWSKDPGLEDALSKAVTLLEVVAETVNAQKAEAIKKKKQQGNSKQGASP